MNKLNDEFIYQVLSIVEEIPNGYVLTYGQIAKISGYEKNSRLVGKVLSMAEYFGNYPCHRVVNSSGRLAPHFAKQEELLKQEGVILNNNGRIDLKKYQWFHNG